MSNLSVQSGTRQDVRREEGSSSRYRHESLARLLTSRIKSGEYQLGDRLPTFAEMYRDYGVSQATVSRAYAALEAEGWLERRRGSGVYVTRKVMASPPSTAVGVVGWPACFHSHKFYWATVLEGIRTGLGEVDQQMMVLDSVEQTRGREDLAGLMILDVLQADAMPRTDLPAVAVLSPQHGMDSVILDDFGGMSSVTEHLLYLGHRRVGFLGFRDRHTHASTSVIVEQRVEGYRAALQRAGISPDPRWLRTLPQPSTDTRRERYDLRGRAERCMTDWLHESGEAGFGPLGLTAVVAFNDDLAIGAVRALDRGGLRVPEEVSVTGFDGLETGQVFQPSLTTVEVPFEELGRVAARRLAERISKPDLPCDRISLPVRTRINASAGPVPRTSHP